MEPSNVAPAKPAQAFEIHPTEGETILLHGWLRGYAQYEQQWRRNAQPYPNNTDTRHIRQEVYEASNGHWVLVETIIEGNTARLDARLCYCWHFESKACVRARFYHCEHTRALFEFCGLPYQVVVGGDA